MGVNQSFIEDVELDNGLTVYVQQSGLRDRVSISIDGPDTSMQFNCTVDEAKKIQAALQKLIDYKTK